MIGVLIVSVVGQIGGFQRVHKMRCPTCGRKAKECPACGSDMILDVDDETGEFPAWNCINEEECGYVSAPDGEEDD